MHVAVYEKLPTLPCEIPVCISVTINPFHEEKIMKNVVMQFSRSSCHPICPTQRCVHGRLAIYQMSHTFRTFGTSMDLHGLMFSCSDGRRDDRRF
jgi:hypothetical protein